MWISNIKRNLLRNYLDSTSKSTNFPAHWRFGFYVQFLVLFSIFSIIYVHFQLILGNVRENWNIWIFNSFEFQFMLG